LAAELAETTEDASHLLHKQREPKHWFLLRLQSAKNGEFFQVHPKLLSWFLAQQQFSSRVQVVNF